MFHTPQLLRTKCFLFKSHFDFAPHLLSQVDCQLDPALPPRAELAWVKVIRQIMITNKIATLIMTIIIIIIIEIIMIMVIIITIMLE